MFLCLRSLRWATSRPLFNPASSDRLAAGGVCAGGVGDRGADLLAVGFSPVSLGGNTGGDRVRDIPVSLAAGWLGNRRPKEWRQCEYCQEWTLTSAENFRFCQRPKNCKTYWHRQQARKMAMDDKNVTARYVTH